jgi:hypothetical protein
LTKIGEKGGWNAWKDASAFHRYPITAFLLTALRVQIQILLYLLKVSLPGPCPPDTDSSPLKKQRHHKREALMTVSTAEGRLESFMDKLSTWQLLGSLDKDVPNLHTSSGHAKEDRDWMQVFCEDLVEIQ